MSSKSHPNKPDRLLAPKHAFQIQVLERSNQRQPMAYHPPGPQGHGSMSAWPDRAEPPWRGSIQHGIPLSHPMVSFVQPTV